MTDIPETPSGPPFLDNPHAPDVFADGLTGLFVWNGNFRLTFEALRVSHISTPGPVNRVVIGRLVLPIAAAEAMARSILDMIERQRSAAASEAPSNITLQ
jgi:hypothetical protein